MFRKIILTFVLIATAGVAFSDEPSWEYRRTSYIAMGESMTSFFSDLGSSADVLMQISDVVKDRKDIVTATYTDKKIIDILNDMVSAYGLLWYWDRQTIYVYDASELSERKIEMYDNGADLLISNLKMYGFYDGRYEIRSNIKGNVVFFAAPPRYSQLIVQVAEEVNLDLVKEGLTNRKLRFRSFPLKYAVAYDRTVTYGGETQVIEGVATLLNRAVYGDDKRSDFSTTKDDEQLLDYGESTKEKEFVGDVVRLEDRIKAEKSIGKEPTITADKQTNSIIVYDTLENINMFEEFIQGFDKPLAQVEISVSIIDVQSDDLNEIGVSWAGNGTDFDVGFGAASAIERTNEAASYIGFGNYQNTTTLMASQVKTLMGNIRAISENNGAKILSKPAVVTQDNLEAIIDHVSTFYVRLEGQEEVELVPIQSGSVLRVVPRLIGGRVEDMTNTEIQLEVSIQDGNTNDNREVDEIPVVNSSTIKTQAVVSNGESLLVGGFYYDSEQEDLVKVPVLGDIPVLGSLFKNTRTRKVKLSRLFLITPKIINSKLNSMQKLSIVDNVDDVRRMDKNDYIFSGMILD